jgi:hypothetical protein
MSYVAHCDGLYAVKMRIGKQKARGLTRILSTMRIFCVAAFYKERQNNLLSGVTKVEAMPKGAKDSDSDKRLGGKFAEALRHNGARGQVSG